MIITCPQCETSFALPDEMYRPGRKARCSQCSYVFRLPDTPKSSDEGEQPLPAATASGQSDDIKKHKKQIVIIGGLIAFCVLAIILGIFMFFSSLGSGGDSTPESGSGSTVKSSSEDQQKALELAKRVSKIACEDVRQFVVSNEAEGKLVVLQGNAVNRFDTQKELIQIEAQLLDKSGQVISQVNQYCGGTLTLFQLQVLPFKDLEALLHDKVSILTNNTSIEPGEKVPFYVVFPPLGSELDQVARFEVRVVGVEDPTPSKESGDAGKR